MIQKGASNILGGRFSTQGQEGEVSHKDIVGGRGGGAWEGGGGGRKQKEKKLRQNQL